MAYETGTASSVEDLVSKLFTFATGLSTTPWTQDSLDTTNKWATLHRGNCYVSFRWVASGQNLGIYQSLGWITATAPHLLTDDSGEGDTGVPSTGRRVNFVSAGPFTAYHFFAGEGDTPYIHVAVEVDSGRYRHFGFGNIIKLVPFTGGEYSYAHYWDQTATYIDNPAGVNHSVGLEGVRTATSNLATMHMEGFEDQGGSEKWVVFSGATVPAGTDRSGETRRTVASGWRGGLWGGYLAWMRYSTPNAHKPFMPMPIIYVDKAASPDTWRWIGQQPDVCVMNMGSFTSGQEVTIGTDTWMVFPLVKKQYTLGDVEESWMSGIAYKKIT